MNGAILIVAKIDAEETPSSAHAGRDRGGRDFALRRASGSRRPSARPTCMNATTHQAYPIVVRPPRVEWVTSELE